jgi:mRNA interferase HigB
VRIVGREKLVVFCANHSDCARWIECWVAETQAANWRTPADVKQRYSSVSFLPKGVVIFNVKGNSYRLATRIAFNTSVLIVDWIGTHAEYDKRDF